MTAVPLAVAAPLTSRHRLGKRTLPIVPLPLNVHCWLVAPLQSQICTRTPLAALAGASRHLPRICSVWPLWVNCWLAPLWQSQISCCVPLAVPLLLTSRHRPEASLRSRKVVGAGVDPP